jgi:transcription initiation factor TFIID subunit 6
MSNQITQKLKTLIETARKFCFHAKRKQLLNKDIDYALRALNMRPILGFYSKELIPFRFATGDGHKIYYYDDEFQPIELADVIARVNLPKLPQEVAIESHWLAIDGIQPAIPENPPPLTKEEQQLECVDPLNSKNLLFWTAKTNVLKKHVETVQIKQLATHELSVEQQLYYKEITEACVGNIELKRHHALNSLAHDPGLHQMLPRLCVFISEGVKVNIVHNNLALIIYLMRMVKSMLDNPTLYLEKYLHELTPTVITCIVSKQICNRPEQENHYALRDFASKLLATICKNYNTSTNCLQTRITRLLCKALDNPNTPLSTVYGCISALCELGPEVKQALLVPRLQMIQEKIRPSSPSQVSRISPEGRIMALLERVHN